MILKSNAVNANQDEQQFKRISTVFQYAGGNLHGFEVRYKMQYTRRYKYYHPQPKLEII
jgi:hypothetical protein